jgi:hypothetical protein
VDSIVIKSTKSELLGRRSGGRRRTVPSIFIAYRMNDPDSRKMRSDLEHALNEAMGVTVLDGNVEDGLPWAEEIRRRIDKAKLIVADITGPSKEVLFEYGFARNKYVILVVHRPQDQSVLPKWITVIQLPPPYESGEITRIADSVAAKVVLRPEGHRPRPAPVPGSALWIQDERSAWADLHFDRARNRLAEKSIDLERRMASEIESAEELRACLRSWLLVTCLDGLSADYLGHFLLGDLIARPLAGVGRGKGESVQRLGIALSEGDPSMYVADSVLRAAGRSLKVANPGALDSVLMAGVERYRKFLRGR